MNSLLIMRKRTLMCECDQVECVATDRRRGVSDDDDGGDDDDDDVGSYVISGVSYRRVVVYKY